MAYSVNWITQVISIPTSDLTLVTGTHYRLQMSGFLGEVRRLEGAFDEGLWAPQILDHTNPKLDFAGTDYAGFDEVINNYTVQVTGAATRVDLLGSNNNIIDVLIATGVSIVPSNSQGLQLVSTGSGVTAQDKTDIINGTWSNALDGAMTAEMMMRLLFAVSCGKVIDAETDTVKFKGADGSKNRVMSTTDEHGNRITVTWDATP